ncbi:MAG: ATP-grasp domain-containing protein, partial [Acidobacteriota bacterium]
KSAAVSTAEEARAFQKSVGSWPIVVKPTGGAGAMSVFFARGENELLHGCQQVMESGLGEVLLEEFIGGDEFAVNGLVDSDGELLVTDVWYYDKRDSHGERNLYYQSVKVSTFEPPFEALVDYAADVVRAMRLRRSPVHLEIKVDDRGPCLIEVGARFAGGDQPVMASKLHHHNLFELAACHYLDDLPFSPSDVDYGHYNRYSARILSGIQPIEIARIRAVLGVDEIESLPSFAGVGFIRPPGVRLPVTKDLNTKSWEVYLFHPDERQVQRDALAVRQLLRYL